MNGCNFGKKLPSDSLKDIVEIPNKNFLLKLNSCPLVSKVNEEITPVRFLSFEEED